MVVLVNWQEVILDLRRAGYSQQRIADAIGCGRTSVRAWCNLVAEPGYTYGARVLKLHSDVIGKIPTPN